MFEIIFLTVTGLYFLVLMFLTSGLAINIPGSTLTPFVSVIIAARNEETNILECLNSLAGQDYKYYEVIIADDHSTDKTGLIIESFISLHQNFKKVNPPLNKLPGKTNALLSAIEIASGDMLLFTDADCIVPTRWISGTVKYYSANTGMVNGFSTANADNILNGIQSIDLIFLVSVAAGMANNGHPASCIGNNVSIKKIVYEETGGYRKIHESITEDYELINSVSKLKKYSVVFPSDKDLVIKTKGEASLAKLISQKKRWASGGLSTPNISLLLMSLSFVTNLCILISIFFYTPQVLTILILKISSDLFFLINIHNKLNLTRNLKYFIFFEIYFILYTTFLPLLLLVNKKITWKEREY